MNKIKNIWKQRHLSKNKLYLINGYYFDREKFIIKKIKINLFILGAQKCATTSLYNFLSKHPNIFMSNPFKEPGYFIFHEHMKVNFAKRGYYIKGRDNLFKTYMARGFKGEKYFGDASVHYTMGLRAKKFNIPKKIFAHNPNAKFIYVIRNPFERIISAYNNYHFQNGTIDQEIKRDPLLVETSKYYFQLSLFQKYFSKDNIKLLIYDDLVSNKRDMLDDVFKFLNVPTMAFENKFPLSNKTKSKEVKGFSNESYKYLIEIFKNDIEQLEKEYNINVFDRWNLSKEKWVV